ncbi:DNA repair protein RAD51 homolog 3-like isoform X2 [Salvelinus fontinalis]|uniref:DNA repair protein RAD51 homolog 3-like isoform X2 n=1 Tax=Salvelinus fontinalis TaxID=8038 RepID=UPI002485F7DA|nr:DNA repair protein RAD51 homolog 3-like isoform X2 [Salvelinus fontinalis]
MMPNRTGQGTVKAVILLHSAPTKDATRGSQEEAVEVLQPVRSESGQERAAAGRLTAQELLVTEQELGTVFTFCSALDTALGGGLPVGKTTEVCGRLEWERPISEQQEALKELTVETIFSTLVLVRYHDYVELLAEMYLLADFLAQHPEVQLVVIDSIAFLFHHCFDDLSQRTRLRNSLAQQLIQMATNRNVAVVLTNQVTSKVWSSQSKLIPALGDYRGLEWPIEA